jgi:hypothetical protein
LLKQGFGDLLLRVLLMTLESAAMVQPSDLFVVWYLGGDNDSYEGGVSSDEGILHWQAAKHKPIPTPFVRSRAKIE